MKKIIGLILIMVLCLTLCGCSRQGSSDDSWRKVSDAGVLKVGVYDDRFPMCSPKGDVYYGYDADMMVHITERLGVQVTYVDILESEKTADELMKEGAIDCAIGGISYSSELEAQYLLSAPYLADQHVIVLGEDSTLKQLSDLTGRSISVVQGSPSHLALRKASLLYDSLGDRKFASSEVGTLLNLLEGTAEVAVTRQSVFNYIAANHGGVRLMQTENGQPEVLGTMEYVMIFPRGSQSLADKVNSVYATMERDHVTDELYNVWFVDKQPVDTPDTDTSTEE